jgi:hypothetical protein
MTDSPSGYARDVHRANRAQTDNGHSHPAAVVRRLEEIDRDLSERQNSYETAAGDRARLIRDWEKRLAVCMRTAKGSDANARKASALVAATGQDDLYERLTDAEGRFEALKAVSRVLEVRSAIGMSVLKSQGRAGL